MNNAIEVKNLRKSYDNHEVLKGIEFNVLKGEIFALLGANGSGKTTTLECIEGIRKNDEGSIVINGKMGIQLQSSSLPDHIRAIEAMNLFAKWNKVKLDNQIVLNLGINDFAKKEYHELSIGQKRRLHLGLCLIHNPDIIFLDEPTSGLDVEGRIALHEEIRKLKSIGKTIILASHDMVEVENLCDRIAILKDGKIAFIGTNEDLTKEFGRKCNVSIKTLEGITEYQTENINETILNCINDLNKKNIEILDIKVSRGTLEEHFISISRGED